jgi:hypothetical protein
MTTPNNHEEEAAKLGFDLTKQFITFALGGIAFVVGLYFSTPNAVSIVLLWSTVAVFAVSTILGLAFLMHGVNILSVQRSYDIYATSLRFLSGLQIILVLIGVALLAPILYYKPTSPTPSATSNTITIQIDSKQSISYPLESDKNYVVEIEGGKVKFSAIKP